MQSHSQPTKTGDPEHRHRTTRPRDAATLLILRKSRRGPEILLGERSAKHAFFANHYIFSGGKVDRSDGYALAATPLCGHVAANLERAAMPHRARASAMAAIRETYEETGLIVGKAAPQLAGRAPADWAAFYATGMAPALDGLIYVLHAITPPGRPRRFNARFFAIDAERVCGETTEGTGELLKIRWFTIDKGSKLKILAITVRALEQIESQLSRGKLDDPDHPIPWSRTVHGKRITGAY